MLTPVRAASNASFSSQGQTAAIVASGLGHSVIAPRLSTPSKPQTSIPPLPAN